MNEQEAMKILDELATFEYVQIEDGDTAIETIKYYVKKLEEEINDLKWKNEIYVKSIKSHKREIEKYKMMLAENCARTVNSDLKQKHKHEEDLEALHLGWKAEIEKQDKIIDEMVEEYEYNARINVKNFCEEELRKDICIQDCRACIKEYFINKVEKGE